MKIIIIAALGSNRAIGKEGKIPWELPDDLLRFRALTMGNSLIMGRHTHASIGRALLGRRNIVLTHHSQESAEGCISAASISLALSAVDSEKVFVIGGEEVYRSFLPIADCMQLTLVNAQFEGDVFFPEFSLADWEESTRERHLQDERHKFEFDFVTFLPQFNPKSL